MDRETIRIVVQQALLDYANTIPSGQPIYLNNGPRRAMAETVANALKNAEKDIREEATKSWVLTGEGEMPP